MRNLLLSIGWCAGAVTHAEESNQDWLRAMADDFRYLYQLGCRQLEELLGQDLEGTVWCCVKHSLASLINDIETFAKIQRAGRPTDKIEKSIQKKWRAIDKMIEEIKEGD